VANDISAELRSQVASRAGYRCEYCGIHENDAGFAHQVDHIMSRKHGGTSTLDNLAYACILCNRHKGTDVATIDPQSGKAVRLFNPRRDRWTDHFRFDDKTVAALTASGRATVRLLRLNVQERIAERRALEG
jgi:hypothetical protein